MRATWTLPLLLLASPALAEDVFYANADLDPVTVEEDAIGLLLNGEVRAWRTGNLALKTMLPAVADALQDWPEVAYVEDVRADRGIYRIVAEAGVDEIALSRRIVSIPGVDFCHPDLEYETTLHTLDDPLIDGAWHLENTGQRGGLPGVDVGAFAAWQTTMGEGQIISIVDTGVDLAQPDLDLMPGLDVGANDDDPSPDPAYDGFAHGTAMAGVAAAIGGNAIGTAGIAPKATTLPVKLLGNEGTTDFDVYDAWTWSADQGASVISNSWGRGTNGCQRVPLSGLLQEALIYVEEEGRGGRGTAIAMSLGNGGCDASNNDMHNDPILISVGAATDIDERASYSNYGDNLEIMGFGAGNGRPGLWTTDITGDLGYNRAADGDYWGGASGTSSACASVAGVLALMFSANERLTAAQARQTLCDTAVKPAFEDANWNAQGWSRLYGCGRIDAAAAVATVADAGPPTVTLDPPGPQTTDVARLSWTGTDPDGDAPTYRLRVWFESDPEDLVIDEVVDGDLAILDSRLFAAAIPYNWSVTPSDRWGEGEAVVGEPFTVSMPPEEPATCASIAPTGLAWLGGLGLLGLLVARRRSEAACAPRS